MLSYFKDFSSLKRVADKLSWALADNALFSLSNLFLNIYLARQLSMPDYGIFVILFSILMIGQSFFNSLLTEPMLVFGGRRYRRHFSQYLGLLLVGLAIFSTLFGILLFVGALILQHVGLQEISSPMLVLIVAAPFVFFSWLMRRACYVCSRLKLAAGGGAVYLVLMLGGLYFLADRELLGVRSALVVMLGGSLLSGLYLCWKIELKWPERNLARFGRLIAARHIRYGAWAAPSRIFFLVPGHIFYFLLPISGGLEATAALRALMNLVAPIQRGQEAINSLLLPALSRASMTAEFPRLVRASILSFLISALLYLCVVGIFRFYVLDFLYGEKYSAYGNYVLLLLLLPVFSGVANVLSSAFRALELPRLVFWAYVCSAGSAILVGAPMIYTIGFPGAVFGMLIASIIAMIVLAVCWLTARARGLEKT